MTTALSMITRSMRLAGVIGKGETPDSDESADGLDALNTMLESWSISRQFVYYLVSESLSLVASQATYTMGASGDLNTTRPTQIDDSCYVTQNGIDSPLTLINAQEYAAIPVKTIESNIGMWMFVDYQYPLVSLSIYPVPNTSMTATIKSWKQLQQFTDLTTALALPPGHKRAIEYSLAEEFGPEFGVVVPQRVSMIASAARHSLKRLNVISQMPVMDTGIPRRNIGVGNIYTGGA
jgi:hypothetical protein